MYQTLTVAMQVVLCEIVIISLTKTHADISTVHILMVVRGCFKTHRHICLPIQCT